MMLVFGVVGYLFKKLKYPLAPLVLALVLGDMAETRFRQSMLLSRRQHGDLLVERPRRHDHDARGQSCRVAVWIAARDRRLMKRRGGGGGAAGAASVA